jgi:putative hydrolases of HD superfamily
MGEPNAGIIDDMPEEARLLLRLDALKDLARQNPLVQGERKERVAEHSWNVALAVALLSGYAAEPIDVGRATLLATVHDVVEAFVGDTFAFGPDVVSKEEREHGAMDRLEASTDSAAVHALVALWREYERQDTPEARFVKGMDAFLPILHNYSNIAHSSWTEHGVRADQVRQRLNKVRDSITILAAVNDRMIDDAQARGYLK